MRLLLSKDSSVWVPGDSYSTTVFLHLLKKLPNEQTTHTLLSRTQHDNALQL